MGGVGRGEIVDKPEPGVGVVQVGGQSRVWCGRANSRVLFASPPKAVIEVFDRLYRSPA